MGIAALHPSYALPFLALPSSRPARQSLVVLRRRAYSSARGVSHLVTDSAWRHQAIVMAFLVLSTGGRANAHCAFEPQGEGRVAAVIDARSFRLDDGREILLAGIEPFEANKAR